MKSDKWNDLLKECIAEQKTQADLESWWSKPAPTPKTPAPAEDWTLEYMQYDKRTRYIQNQPSDQTDMQIPTPNEKLQSAIGTVAVVLAILLAVIAAGASLISALS